VHAFHAPIVRRGAGVSMRTARGDAVLNSDMRASLVYARTSPIGRHV
jgi:hypothetical protein